MLHDVHDICARRRSGTRHGREMAPGRRWMDGRMARTPETIRQAASTGTTGSYGVVGEMPQLLEEESTSVVPAAATGPD